MAHFTSYDGAKLAYHRTGSGPPLVCLPGGPGLGSGYLGDLGGLGRSRELILAALFPGWDFTVQPGAGHFPWLDDPAWCTGALSAFLAGPPPGNGQAPVPGAAARPGS